MDIDGIKKLVNIEGLTSKGPGAPVQQVDAPKYIAEFDSAWAMLKALANSMAGKDFPGLGALPAAKPIEAVVGNLSRSLGQRVYALAGWSETVSAEEVRSIKAEEISKAVLGVYPETSDEALMIGSANGALIHLCAALHAAWLPQTFLIPLRRKHIDPDDISADMEWGRKPGATLLKNNPDLTLYQMHDPDHDRLMVKRMAYFRIKRRSLGDTYRRFLEEKVKNGATVYIIECEMTWPTRQVAERHFFQSGGGGGIPPEEYLNGSERVSQFLRTQGSSRERWDPPEPDGESPEAEWGFDPVLREEIVDLVKGLGGRVVRVVFDEPEDMSPLVADFHRWWYRREGLSPDHLLAESFAFVAPYWALRTRSIPYWALFSGRKSAEYLNRYLDTADPYEYIYIMLLSNGMDPVERVSIDDWRRVLQRARVRGDFVGVDEEKFPYDFASFLRYNEELQERIPFRHEMPGRLPLSTFEEFLSTHGNSYNVRFTEVS